MTGLQNCSTVSSLPLIIPSFRTDAELNIISYQCWEKAGRNRASPNVVSFCSTLRGPFLSSRLGWWSYLVPPASSHRRFRSRGHWAIPAKQTNTIFSLQTCCRKWERVYIILVRYPKHIKYTMLNRATLEPVKIGSNIRLVRSYDTKLH